MVTVLNVALTACLLASALAVPRPNNSGGGSCNGPIAYQAKNYILVGYAVFVTNAADLNGCANKCLQAAKDQCQSGMFYPNAKENNCIFNAASRTTQPNQYTVEKEDNVVYFEPCVSATSKNASASSDKSASGSESCSGSISYQADSHVLVAHVDNVTSAKNLDECARRCVQAGKDKCQSGMFYSKSKEMNCILNAASRSSQPDQYVEEKEDSVVYFEPCLAKSDSSAASSGACDGIMSNRAKNQILVGNAMAVVSAKDITACANSCTKTKGCQSGMFYSMVKINNCVLNSETRQTKPDTYTEDAETVEYFDLCKKAAAPASSPKGRSKRGQKCNGKTSIRISGYILVGAAEDVVTAKNLEECASKCLKKGYQCNSGMFYPESSEVNCILNKGSRDTLKDQFYAETVDKVEYFEPCKKQ